MSRDARMLRTRIGHVGDTLLRIPKGLINARRVSDLQKRRSLRLHLGCGGDRLPDCINIDYRPTPATDVTMDLNVPRLAPSSVALAFSNAFFEHLYRPQRLAHLRRIRESLEADGVCCYIGVPYFRNIAKFYLEKAPGTLGPVFDLYNVYRYTHGDPEHQQAWWLGQLHKSLFDEEELSALLADAGFQSFVMFCYGYPGDDHELPVTMGFYAARAAATIERQRGECLRFLERFADQRIRLSTLLWLWATGAPSLATGTTINGR
jgi:predicted SAM-dependent methyltransferase